MKSWILIAGVLAGCVQQPADTTDTTAQALSAATCPGPNNYPYAKLPAISLWNGTHKSPALGQYLISFPNPNQVGYSLVLLVDPVKGYIPWGATFKSTQLGNVRATAGNEPWIDFPHHPPPPPPVGDGWLASYALELALDYSGTEARAAGNVQIPTNQ